MCRDVACALLHALLPRFLVCACMMAHACMQEDGAGPADVAVADAEPPRERAAKPAGKAGGVYIPPFKLAQLLREADDKSRWALLKISCA